MDLLQPGTIKVMRGNTIYATGYRMSLLYVQSVAQYGDPGGPEGPGVLGVQTTALFLKRANVPFSG